VLEQRVHELVAPVGEDGLAGRGLELSNGSHDVVADDGRVPPDGLVEGPRDDVLRRRVHHVAERVARLHRLERGRVDHVRLASEEERIDVLHQRTEGPPDVVVPVRHRPAAVPEAALGVLVGAAGRLHDAVERDEL
jgi:hypothetical protein